MKTLLPAAAIAATLLGCTAALAAPAQVTTTLNLRTGPSTGYAIETALPAGALVDVRGCTRGRNWCRVNWNGYDGWASSAYLADRQTGYRRHPGRTYAAGVAVPLIAGAVIGGILSNNHHDRDHARRAAHRHPVRGRPAHRQPHHNAHSGHNDHRGDHDRDRRRPHH